MPTPNWQRGNATPASTGNPSRGLGESRGLRGQGDTRGRGAPNQPRVRRITGQVRRRVLYKIREWHRDSMLEILGVDPADPTTHEAYHRVQGFDPTVPPFCIKKGACIGLSNFYYDCSNVPSEEAYYAFWQEWAHQQERAQQAQWDNYVKFANVNSTAPVPPHSTQFSKID